MPFNRFPLRCLATALLPLLLAGCMRVPPGSLWSLRQFDFEHFDPAALRVAVLLPHHYGLAREPLRFEATIQRRDHPAQVEQFAMRPSPDAADSAGLPPAAARDGRWVVLRFEPSEAQRVRELRQRVLAMKAAAPQGGSLNLRASPHLCHTGAAPQGAGKVSAALRWTPEKGYVTLLRETELETLLSAMSDRTDLPLC